MLSDVALGASVGVALGIVTGLPLGVVNVAVAVTAATAGRGPAVRIGLGGASADGVHALGAFTGLAALLANRPRLTASLSLIAGALLVMAAIASLRRPGASPTAPPVAPARPFWFGVALTLPNPAALSAWLAVAGALALPSMTAAIAAAVGVTLGSAGYFAGLAVLATRVRRTPGTHSADRRLIAAALGLAGLAALVRGAWSLRG